MDGGLRFGDSAVVYLDIDRFTEDEQVRAGLAASRDQGTLGDGVGVGADSHGHFRGGVSAVDDADGDEVVAGFFRSGKDGFDAEVGQALVGVDPIAEEPVQVAAVSGLLKEFLKGAGRGGLAIAEADISAGVVGTESGGERGSPTMERSIQKT